MAENCKSALLSRPTVRNEKIIDFYHEHLHYLALKKHNNFGINSKKNIIILELIPKKT